MEATDADAHFRGIPAVGEVPFSFLCLLLPNTGSHVLAVWTAANVFAPFLCNLFVVCVHVRTQRELPKYRG